MAYNPSSLPSRVYSALDSGGVRFTCRKLHVRKPEMNDIVSHAATLNLLFTVVYWVSDVCMNHVNIYYHKIHCTCTLVGYVSNTYSNNTFIHAHNEVKVQRNLFNSFFKSFEWILVVSVLIDRHFPSFLHWHMHVNCRMAGGQVLSLLHHTYRSVTLFRIMTAFSAASTS